MNDRKIKNKTSPRFWWKQILRGLRHRLIRPILRERKPPEYTARSVLVGMVVAMTPTVGVQIPMVLLIWMAVHNVYSRWDFNPVLASAWTFITNIATLPFFYYLFVVTGRVMLGRFENLKGFDTFRQRLGESLPQDAGWLDSLWIYTIALFDNFGLPLFVGSIPWAILGGWLGYRWSLRLVTNYRVRHPLKRTDP
jgi:hypothetical protein